MVVLGRHAHGFERHAADRTVAWALLHDLGVHRAGVERALGQRLRLALLVEETLGFLGEFAAAALGAKIISLAFMFVRGLAHHVSIDHHSADRIDSHVAVAEIAPVHAGIFLETVTP
jgi:hypothetical protein